MLGARGQVVLYVVRRLPMHSVPLTTYRFHGNIVGLVRDGVQLSRFHIILERMYKLDLQLEGEACVLPSLEARITIDRQTRQTRQAGIQLRDKVIWSERPKKRIMWFPHPHSVGTQAAVASIAAAYGMKGAWYTATISGITANAKRVARNSGGNVIQCLVASTGG